VTSRAMVLSHMPSREVYQADGIEWLRQADLGSKHAVVTSLPDVSELPTLGFEGWRRWFIDVAALICGRVHEDAVAIFYQTDIKRDGRWIDKGHLVQRGADDAGTHCLWHKVVCRTTPGGTTFGRPAYGHWLAFSRNLRFSPASSTADVLPQLGEMTWSRAMPMTAAVGSSIFLRDHTACSVVIDPFCGRGTMLAVANNHGFDAIGIELSKKRVRKARSLSL